MKELSIAEVSEVNGGFDLFNIGASITGILIAFIFGGPAVGGAALCGLAMTTGINGMVELSKEDCLGTNPNEQRPK